MTNENDYDVGYAKPPKHTQFRKGQSGNPKGRPRRDDSIGGILERTLSRRATITDGGKTKTVSLMEYAIMSSVDKAMKGSVRDLEKLIQMISKYVPEANTSANDMPEEFRFTVVKGVDGKPAVPTDEEWEFLMRRRSASAKKKAAEAEEENDDFLN